MKDYLFELTEAINDGCLDSVEELVNKVDNLNYALERACFLGNKDIAKFLYECGAKIDHQKGKPLCSACKSGHFEIVKWILTKSHVGVEDALEISIENEFTRIALYLSDFVEPDDDFLDAAIRNKNPVLINLYLSRGYQSRMAIIYLLECRYLDLAKKIYSSSNSFHINDGDQIFFAAVESDMIDAVEWTINIGVLYQKQLTHALYYAKSLEMTNYLINLGGEVDEESIIQSISKDISIMKRLLQEYQYDNSYSEILEKAITSGTLDQVKYLVEYGINPYEGDLLFLAIARKHYPITKYLIEIGLCDFSALSTAIYTGNVQIIELLISSGWEITDHDKDCVGFSGNCDLLSLFDLDLPKTLNNAISEGRIEMVTKLLSQGIEPTQKTLEEACEYGDVEIVQKVIRKNHNLKKATIVAIKSDAINCVKFMVKCGVKIKKSHYRLLDMSISPHKLELVDYISDRVIDRKYLIEFINKIRYYNQRMAIKLANKIAIEMNEVCQICFEGIKKSINLECPHHFHIECLFKYKSDKCSMCHQDLIIM